MQMHCPACHAKHRAQPHKHKHPDAQTRADIQFFLRSNDFLEYDVHDTRCGWCNEVKESRDEREGYEMVAVPTGQEDERREEDQQEGGDDA